MLALNGSPAIVSSGGMALLSKTLARNPFPKPLSFSEKSINLVI
jgi:hypothetical protein